MNKLTFDMKRRLILLTYIILIGISMISCQKDFLDAKPNTNIVSPTTLNDFQQLLDNNTVMNAVSPASFVTSADEFYITNDVWNSLTTKTEHNEYIWASDIYNGEKNIADWNYPYQAIFYANIVLDGFNKLSSSDQTSDQGKNIKGWAYFLRAFAFYNLVQEFGLPYDSSTSNSTPGIPLKLLADINDIEPRASLEQVYDQIHSDLLNAKSLVQVNIPFSYPNRVSLPAVYALLARIAVTIGKYQLAKSYADSCLQLYNTLIDYNTISKTSTSPFASNNSEVMFRANQVNANPGTTCLSSFIAEFTIDTSLYNSYDSSDLRKQIYFQNASGRIILKKGYNGSSGIFAFTGLATDEIYLIRSESRARLGDLQGAMDDLNALLINRHITGTYTSLTASDMQDALAKIFNERKKELVFRGLRWTDLKRLNKEGANITLTRNLNGSIYTLPPNDPKYILPIPPDEISQSGIQQNIR